MQGLLEFKAAPTSKQVFVAKGFDAVTSMSLANAASRYQADVLIRKGSRIADARSSAGLVLMGVVAGDTIEIEACGVEAHRAITGLSHLIENGFYLLGRPVGSAG